MVSDRLKRQHDAEREIVFGWCRRLDLPLMSPPRAPEAIDALGREVERVNRELHQVHLNYHHMVDVAQGLRAALRQADLRLEQINRDRRERDKVFATTTTARAEIARALDEIQDGGTDGHSR